MARTTDAQHESAPRWLWGLGLALAALAVCYALQIEGTLMGDYLGQLEHKSLDTRFVLRERLRPTQVEEDIVILLIDDWGIEDFEYPELAGIGEVLGTTPWPWPRVFYGLAVQYLTAAGARAIFFDFAFTAESALGADDDAALAHFAEEAKNVSYPLLFLDPVGRPSLSEGLNQGRNQRLLEHHLERFPEGKLEQASVPVDDGRLTDYRDVQLPVRTLAGTARDLGSATATIDSDGVVRRVELLSRFRGRTYPAVSLVLAAQALGEEIGWDPDGPWVTLGERRIPVDDRGRMLLNWHGGAGTYASQPLHKLILKSFPGSADPEEDRALYDGKTVLMGSSALALVDLKSTPLDPRFPGVEVHATALDNILNGDFVQRPGALARFLLTAALFVVAGLVLARRQGAGTALAIFVALLLTYGGAASAVFVSSTIWLDLVVPSGGLVLLFAGVQTFQYLTEGRQRREMRNTFQRYLPPAVVDEVLKLPADELKLGGDRRELTVYFTDIAGFTSISERLEPERLVRLLNTYLGEMSDIISARKGTLDKYIGDCIMAFWGAPLPVESHALEACLAALESRERAVDLNRRFREQELPEIHARIGINTGPMLVGNMGSDQHFAFTVMGDAVNLASRLEGANKQYGTTIMLGPETVAQAREGIEARELDLLRVKGRSEPVQVYELLARRGELTEAQRRLQEAYAEALAAYQARDWAAALAGFEACLGLDAGDGPSQTYRDRCVHYLEQPPSADWDGVFEMRTK